MYLRHPVIGKSEDEVLFFYCKCSGWGKDGQFASSLPYFILLHSVKGFPWE